MAAAQTGGSAVSEIRHAGIQAAGVGGSRIAKGNIQLPDAREVRVSLLEKPPRLEWIQRDGEIAIAAHLANDGGVVIQVPSGQVSPLPASFSGHLSGEYWPPCGTTGGILNVTRSGNLIWSVPGRPDIELGGNLLPDTRTAALDDGIGSIRRFAAFASPTSRYPHGILGDRLEAAGWVVVSISEDRPESPAMRRITLPVDGVIEGMAPIAADIAPNDGFELILPVSTAEGGTRLIAVTGEGTLVAEGDPVGRGFRWRHVLFGAPLGSGGETEIAAIRTPHIGGVLEFCRVVGNKLQVVHERAGYSTHRIGERTVDTALTGYFSSGGGMGVLLPTQNQRSLALIERVPGGLREVLQIDLPGAIATNLTAAPQEDRSLVVAVGTDDGTLTFWY